MPRPDALLDSGAAVEILQGKASSCGLSRASLSIGSDPSTESAVRKDEMWARRRGGEVARARCRCVADRKAPTRPIDGADSTPEPVCCVGFTPASRVTAGIEQDAPSTRHARPPPFRDT